MKFYTRIIILALAAALIFPCLSAGDTIEPDYKQYTDVVVEWTPNGSMIQVGDFLISKIKSVLLYQGQKDLQGKRTYVTISKSQIRVGRLATPMMLDQDQDGNWIAEKLILYSGTGLEEELERLPNDVKQSFLSFQN